MDLESTDAKEVADLAARRWRGLQLMRSLLDDDETGYEACGGFELFRAQDRDLLDHCLKQLGEIDTLVSEATGLKNIYSYQTTLPPGLRQGCEVIFNAYEGRLDTGKLYSSLLARVSHLGVQILNGVKVHQLREGNSPELRTSIGRLYCHKMIVTVNAFATSLLPGLDVRPARNQVVVSRPIPGLKLDGCFHLDRGYFYFRNIGERLLIGGGRHLLGQEEETVQMSTTETGVDMLLGLATEVLELNKRPEPEWQWSGILGIGSRKLPIIDEVAQNVYCAVRMGGMGVALSSVAGREVSELI